MQGQEDADGRSWINFEKALAHFGLASEQLHYILDRCSITTRGPMRTEGPGGTHGPGDYYNAQELEAAVRRYRREGLEQ